MTLANSFDPRSSNLPDSSYYNKPDEAFMSMQNRVQLGIGTKDTLGQVIVPFTQMQNPSKNYQATPDRPLLDLSLINARVLLRPNGDATPEPGPLYQSIIALLPRELQESFQNPPLTAPLLIAMDKVFQGVANTLSVYDALAVPPPLDSPAESNGIAFNRLPETLSKSFTSLGNQLLPALNDSLENIGRNDPNYDSLSNLLNQTRESFSGFQNLLAALGESPPPSNINDLKSQVSDDVNRLNSLYNSKDNGSDLTILKSFLNALTLLSSALTTTKGNPSVMLAASFGNIGIESSKSAGGTLGPGLATINQSVANGLNALYSPNGSPGDKQTLNQLLNIVSVLGLGLGAQFASHDYGEASLEQPNLSRFGYDVGMTFLSNTSGLTKLFGLAGSAAGIDDRHIGAASKAMSAAFLVQLAYAGSSGNASSFESLMKLIGGPLSNQLTDIENDINAGISNGTISGEKANTANVGITHARLALANEDYEGFLSALNTMFDETGTSSEQVNRDLKLVKGNADVIQNAFSGATREGSESITGIQRLA